MNLLKNAILYIISELFITSFFFCSYSRGEPQEVAIINELVDCETENIHYRILDVYTTKYNNSLSGEIILPVLSNKINTKENNELLWPAFTNQRILVRVTGRYANRVKPRDYYGCTGVHEFRIDSILSVTDVTHEMDFKISDKIICGSGSTVEPERIFIKIDTFSDPEKDFRGAISEEDCRFAGVMEFSLIVPNVPDYEEKYSKTNGVKIIEGTGDDFSKMEEISFQKYAIEYAGKYNTFLLKYMHD